SVGRSSPRRRRLLPSTVVLAAVPAAVAWLATAHLAQLTPSVSGQLPPNSVHEVTSHLPDNDLTDEAKESLDHPVAAGRVVGTATSRPSPRRPSTTRFPLARSSAPSRSAGPSWHRNRLSRSSCPKARRSSPCPSSKGSVPMRRRPL